MKFLHVFDEIMLYIQLEKNYSENTLRSYEFDQQSFKNFLITNKRSLKVI